MRLSENWFVRQILALKQAMRFWFYKRAEPDVIARFHTLYYMGRERGETWRDTRWMGTPTLKCPLDLWIYQEILFELRPDLIIETGTFQGGSAHYLASLCDLLDNGSVITIDIAPKEGRPEHPRIEYLTGSSISEECLAIVRERAQSAQGVLVILDSAHEKEHVAKEIESYSPLVTAGSYLIVEDTHLNGNPIRPEFGPGPMEAAKEFLARDQSFVEDPIGRKFLMTFNPNGYLRRTNSS